MTETAPRVRREPGSFRDPHSRVFYVGDDVYRGLSAEAAADFEALQASGLLERLVADGKVIATEAVDEHADDEFAAVLRHDAVPFVSYPYEWPFSMLRDAALLQLELLLAALDAGLMLKDATPYNVQWRGTRPVFIDVGSFERRREGEPWAGYRQFCMLFLYPLLLTAHRGIDFQPLLRGRLDGITPRECRSLLTWRDLLRRGMPTHVVLHSRFEERHAPRRRDVGGELRRAGFHEGLIRANVARLQRLVRGLRRRPRASAWRDYGTGTYSEHDSERKAAFVREVAGSRRWRLVWDVGANDGRFSRIAADHASTVVAIDADHAVVDDLYRSLRAEDSRTILPLVADVADPSPPLGWRGVERKALWERASPDLTLALALVHHLAITRNVPLADVVDWLASLGSVLVVEFPTAEDEMVGRLVAAKAPGTHADYRLDLFERLLGGAFVVERREVLSSGTRVLFHASPRR